MPDPSDAPIATRFGRYVLGRRVGTGGMAVVDAAFQRSTGGGRLVALKRVSRELSRDPAARRMFLREASIAARIEHPNVVRTYEVGEEAGEAFIAMELLEGATIAELARRCPQGIPRAMAIRIVRDALRGLHVAHELCSGGEALGLVHQDISPQNIHVAYEGTTRILDFGVARMAALDLSRTDTVRGKACYLAPEQLALGATDRRADIFAIGIVLHELLTNAPLFPRARPEASYAAILSGEIPAPKSICPDIPEPIDAVVRRALSRHVDDRFATAEEMRAALLEAEERCGMREIDVGALGAWVRSVAPPDWTRDGLERELSSCAAERPIDAGAELQTLPLRRASSAPRAPRSTTRRRKWLAVGATTFAVAVEIVVRLWMHHNATETSSLPSATNAIADAQPPPFIAREMPRDVPSAQPAASILPPTTSTSASEASATSARPPSTVAVAPSPIPRQRSASKDVSRAPAPPPTSSDPLATQ